MNLTRVSGIFTPPKLRIVVLFEVVEAGAVAKGLLLLKEKEVAALTKGLLLLLLLLRAEAAKGLKLEVVDVAAVAETANGLLLGGI
jgi:hypothetical protein